MPSQAEVRWSQLKVGVIVLVSLALLCTLLFLMTSAAGTGVFQKHLVITAYFDNASGLRAGAPVELEGVTIGEVQRVKISTDPMRKLTPVEVVMKLSPHFQASLHKDSVASLETSGVLGDTILEINSQKANGPQLENNDELPTKDEPSIQDVVQSSQQTVKSVNEIMPKVNDIISAIDNGKGTAGKLVNDPALYNRAVQTVNELQALANNLNAGKGTAGKLLTDDTLYNNLNTTLTQTNAILAQVNSGKGGLGMLIKDPAFANKLNDTVSKLDLILTNVDAGKGTLGKLATDDTAYNNLNKLLTQSTELVTMIRQDPKKYLTIHMKIF